MALHQLKDESSDAAPEKADVSESVKPTEISKETVGALLRRTREKHGQNLSAIADALCIRTAYLEAIESGRYDDLPGTPYAMGFLRSYAEFLSLDAEYVLRCFKEESSQGKVQQELVIPEPITEIRRPAMPLILASLVFLGLAAGGWLYFTKRGPETGAVTPSVSERLQNMFEDLDGAGNAQTATPGIEENPQNPAAESMPETEFSGDGIFREEVEEDQLAVTPEPESAPSDAADDSVAPEEEGQASPPAPAPESPATGDSDASLSPEVAPQDQPERVAADLAEPVAEPQAEAETAEAAAAEEPADLQTDAPEGTAETAVAAKEPTETAAGPQAGAGEGTQSAAAEANRPLLQNASLTETGTQVASAESIQAASLPVIPGAEDDAAAQAGYAREPVVYGEATEDTRIVLKAQQDSWVQVRDAEEKLLLTRVLRSGDLYFVPDQEGLTLLTGNAGGLEIQVDGTALPQIGPIGVVRKDIPLEPAKLLDGSAFRR